MDLTLEHMGAYTATAPYNCPKSDKILKAGLRYIIDESEDAGRYTFGGVGLLAGIDHLGSEICASDPAKTYTQKIQERLQADANGIITSPLPSTSDQQDTSSMITWQRGHTLIFLAEYYLVTGDASVLPAIEAW